MYYIQDEASEEILGNYNDLEDAINDAKNIGIGKHFVVDDIDNILFDTNPGVSYKL